MKIKSSDLNIVLLCLTFYEITIIPHYAFLAFKYLVLFWILYQYYKEWKKNKIILTFAGIYGLMTCFSSSINGLAFNTVFASAMFGIQIIDIFLTCIYYINHKSLGKLVRVVMLVFLSLLFVNDVLMIFIEYNFSNPDEEYLIGNKFIVSYLHCFTSMLAFVNVKIKGKNKVVFSLRKGMIKANNSVDFLFAVAFSIFSLIICAKVTCSTGMIACATMLLIIMLPGKIQSFIIDGKIMVIVTCVSNILVLGTYSLLSMPFFENIIYNVFEKSYTWTGRLIIWEKIFGLIRENPILGYGYYNNVVDRLVGFGNPQNGVLKLLIDTGVIGLFLYTLIVWRSFQHPKKSEPIELYPISAFFYAMIVASIVEINLTHMIVFMAMALFYAESCKIREGHK